MIQLSNSSQINYLVGSPQIHCKVWTPFAPILCDFLSELTKEIKNDPEARNFPDLLTFCFWARKGNLKNLKQQYLDEKVRLGQGLSFHVTPGNVPTNFAFSFAFSLLAGNSNIVKVPSRHFPQVEIFCKHMNQILKQEKYSEIQEANIFIKYSPDNNITKEFTNIADAKIFWGSNETISSLQALPSPPRAKTLAFPNRYSFCVIDANKILELDQESLIKLSQDFYNDTYLMDQNACSSPTLIAWFGENCESAKKIFWKSIKELTSNKYKIETASVVDKLTEAAVDLTTKKNKTLTIDNKNIYRLELTDLSSSSIDSHSRCGYFYEYSTIDLKELSPLMSSSCQTITYYGDIKNQIIDTIITQRVRGVDRIVPIGKALEIGPEWDGIETIKALSRIITIQ